MHKPSVELRKLVFNQMGGNRLTERYSDRLFDLINSATFNAIMNLSIDFNKPIGNGIITALNLNQALLRSIKSNIKKPNKGSEAANAVISILKNGPKKI